MNFLDHLATAARRLKCVMQTDKSTGRKLIRFVPPKPVKNDTAVVCPLGAAAWVVDGKVREPKQYVESGAVLGMTPAQSLEWTDAADDECADQTSRDRRKTLIRTCGFVRAF